MNGAAWRLTAVAALAAGGVWLLAWLGVDVRHLSAEHVRAAVLAHGVWAPLVYLVVFGQPIVPLPSTAMLALAGVVFGRWWGPVAGLAGACLRAGAAFAIARLLGRDTVRRLLHGHVAKLDAKLSRHAFKSVLLIRMIPNVPYDMQSYALSFSQVRFPTYMLATLVGLIPWSIAFAYLGDSLTDPRQTWKLVAAIALVIAVALLPRLFRAAGRDRTIRITGG